MAKIEVRARFGPEREVMPDNWTLRIDRVLLQRQRVIIVVRKVPAQDVSSLRSGQNFLYAQATHAASKPLVKFLRVRTATYANAALITASINDCMITLKKKYWATKPGLVS